jgi:Chaperone of endosialidase
MSVIIAPKRTATASKVPTTSDLADGEMAVNSTDRKIYMRVGAAIVEIFKNLTKADVGLSNVDNTSDAAKPISSATQTALNAKAPLTGTGTSGTWPISITGSAATLTTARTLTIGDTGKTFNGGANVSWTLAEIGAVSKTASETIGGTKTISGETHFTATNAQIWFDGGANTSNTNRHITIIHSKTSGNIGFYDARLSAFLMKIDFNNNTTFAGNVVCVALTETSDATLKTTIRDFKLRAPLRPREFKWIESGKEDFGFIAQEVETVYPEAVFTNEEGIKSISYGKLSAILAAELIDLRDRVTALEAR